MGKKLVILVFFLSFFILILAFNLYKTFDFLWADISVIKNFPFTSYDWKMHQKYGPYYDFMVFVRENTPQDAVILIPPIQPPWAGSGNGVFSNYFLYPRKLINGEINQAPNDFSKFTHVLVVWKDFEAKGLENLYGWPKFKVPAKEILYMDNDNGKLFKVVKGSYSPSEEINIGRYGLIKL